MASSNYFTHPRLGLARLVPFCDLVLFPTSFFFEDTPQAICILPEVPSGHEYKMILDNLWLSKNPLHLQLGLFCFQDRLELYGANTAPRRLAIIPLDDEVPPTPPPNRLSTYIILPTLTKFHLVWRRVCDVMLLFSCLFEHTLTDLCVQPIYQSGRKYKYIRTCSDKLNQLYIFDPTGPKYMEFLKKKSANFPYISVQWGGINCFFLLQVRPNCPTMSYHSICRNTSMCMNAAPKGRSFDRHIENKVKIWSLGWQQ